jgi:hypothetical protein
MIFSSQFVADDNAADETSSSGSSSGIEIVGPNNHVYAHLCKNADIIKMKVRFLMYSFSSIDAHIN